MDLSVAGKKQQNSLNTSKHFRSNYSEDEKMKKNIIFLLIKVGLPLQKYNRTEQSAVYIIKIVYMASCVFSFIGIRGPEAFVWDKTALISISSSQLKRVIHGNLMNQYFSKNVLKHQ